MPALLISRDLLSTSQITGPARQLGIEMRVVADWRSVREDVAAGVYTAIYLDLATPGVDVPELIVVAGTVPVCAFGPHVATQLLENARQAGCAQVHPRSRFFSQLPQILQLTARNDDTSSANEL